MEDAKEKAGRFTSRNESDQRLRAGKADAICAVALRNEATEIRMTFQDGQT